MSGRNPAADVSCRRTGVGASPAPNGSTDARARGPATAAAADARGHLLLRFSRCVAPHEHREEYGLCLTNKSVEDRHPLRISQRVSSTETWPTGYQSVTLTCPTGTMPVAPGCQLAGGAATFVCAEPTGLDEWRIGMNVTQPTTATLLIRCLSMGVGKKDCRTHKLVLSHASGGVEVLASQTVTGEVICSQ